MLIFKPGVKFTGLSAQISVAIYTAERIWERAGYDLTVTCISDGKHKAGSLHYVGHAVDLRSRDIRDADLDQLITALRAALGYEFDVVVERTHIHVEWQPKEQLG